MRSLTGILRIIPIVSLFFEHLYRITKVNGHKPVEVTASLKLSKIHSPTTSNREGKSPSHYNVACVQKHMIFTSIAQHFPIGNSRGTNIVRWGERGGQGNVYVWMYVLKFINNSWAIQPMIITYLITRCHLDNPVKLDESHHACKITWIEFLITLCLVKTLFKSANENILLRLDSFEKPYKQLEFVSHRDIRVHILHQKLPVIVFFLWYYNAVWVTL
jgi:hypothetical protein